MNSKRALALCLLATVAGCTSDDNEGSEIDVAKSAITTSDPELTSSVPPAESGVAGPSDPEWRPLPAGTPNGVGPAAYKPDRSTLLAQFFALSEVAAPAEAEAFFASNVPESEILECMESRGFTYMEDLSPEQMVSVDPYMSLPRDEFARQYGFGISATRLELFPPFPPNPNDAYVESLSSAQQAAWNEAARACRNMTTDGATYSTALNRATEEFRQTVNADDRLIVATEKYGSCMEGAGFDYDSPIAIRGHFATLASQASSTTLQEILRDEITAAVADESCGEPLIETFRTVATERFAEFESMLEARLADPHSAGQPQG